MIDYIQHSMPWIFPRIPLDRLPTLAENPAGKVVQVQLAALFPLKDSQHKDRTRVLVNNYLSLFIGGNEACKHGSRRRKRRRAVTSMCAYLLILPGSLLSHDESSL